MATKAKSKSGSKKLAEAGRGFDPAQLRSLVATLKKHKLDEDVVVVGSPNVNFVKGKFTATDAKAVSEVLRDVIKLDGVHKPIKVFPIGIPAIDRFDVRIEGVRAH
jgi:hypothetical protein